jgi:hypothetical protein
MAKNAYPLTTLMPLQKVNFRLANGQSVRVLLMPQPDRSGTQIEHVEMDYAEAGSTLFVAVGHEGQRRSVTEAAEMAWQIALSQARRAGGTGIAEILLEGEEFLEKADIEKLTGPTIPVTIF